jgi:hypothetical protein
MYSKPVERRDTFCIKRCCSSGHLVVIVAVVPTVVASGRPRAASAASKPSLASVGVPTSACCVGDTSSSHDATPTSDGVGWLLLLPHCSRFLRDGILCRPLLGAVAGSHHHAPGQDVVEGLPRMDRVILPYLVLRQSPHVHRWVEYCHISQIVHEHKILDVLGEVSQLPADIVPEGPLEAVGDVIALLAAPTLEVSGHWGNEHHREVPRHLHDRQNHV